MPQRKVRQAVVKILKLGRLENSMLPVAATLAGYLLAGGANKLQLLLSIIVLVLLHSFVTIWNDIADEAGDKHNGITRIGEIRKLQAYRLLIAIQASILGLSIVICLFLPIQTSLLFGALLLLGWVYNLKPVQASHRPILSIAVLGISYGFIPFWVGVSLGKSSWLALPVATGWTLVRASLSILKDYKDAPGDAAANKRTFLLVYGGKLTAKASFHMAILGYALIVAGVSGQFDRYHGQADLVLGVVVAWLLFERTKLFRANEYARLNQIFHDCVLYQLMFDGLVVACLYIL